MFKTAMYSTLAIICGLVYLLGSMSAKYTVSHYHVPIRRYGSTVWQSRSAITSRQSLHSLNELSTDFEENPPEGRSVS